MMTDTHVDGNALGGLLYDLFGREMTHQRGCCDKCGTVSALGSVLVYRGPGEVLRCPACRNVVMVVVSSPAGVKVTFESLRWVAISDPDAS